MKSKRFDEFQESEKFERVWSLPATENGSHEIFFVSSCEWINIQWHDVPNKFISDKEIWGNESNCNEIQEVTLDKWYWRNFHKAKWLLSEYVATQIIDWDLSIKNPTSI